MALGRLLRFKPLKFNSKVEPLFEMNKINSTGVNQIEKLSENSANDQILAVLVKIDKSIGKLLKKHEADEINNEKILKWRHAAIVLDTLFLYVSIVYVIITFISIIMSAPNLYRPT